MSEMRLSLPCQCAVLKFLLPLAMLLCLSVASNGSSIGVPADAPRAPGRLVDVGDHKVHVRCTGAGRPTVVFEAGAGAFSVDFALVQREVETFTRVCSYDRAGYAWSEPGPMPRTMRQIAYELHEALHKSGVPPPYVLVGHSLGGLMVRVFADRYPREVAGMVLVDSTSEDTVLSINGKPVRMRELAKGRAIPGVQSAPKTLGHQARPSSPPSPQASTAVEPPFDRLPVADREARAWAQSLSDFAKTNSAEFEWLAEELARIYEARKKNPSPLGDKPLIVLVPEDAGIPPAGDPTVEEYRKIMIEKRQQKRDMTKLSKNSLYVEVPNTRHEIHIDQPTLLAAAIRAVVNASRSHGHARRLPADAAGILESR